MKTPLLAAMAILIGAGCASGPLVGPQPDREPPAALRRAPLVRSPEREPRSTPHRGLRIAAGESARYQATGPFPVDLREIPPGVYDPFNQLDRGRWGGPIGMPISAEEAARRREESLTLPPSDRVQRIGPLEALGPGRLAPTVGVGFDGPDYTECCGGGGNVPPDPELAVGPNHVIAVVNVAFAIFDKSGTLLAGPITFSSFFSGVPGCSYTGVFDPNVLYDESADRFVLGIDGDGDDYCVAATAGSDPTDTWYGYGVPTASGGKFFDYPHAGVGRDAIYLGANIFRGQSFLEGRVWALDKAALYAGTTMTVVTHSTGDDDTPQPMHLHGYLQGSWPTSGPHYFVTDRNYDGASYEVWGWSDPFGADTFTDLGTVDLEAATGVTAGFPVDVPQSGASTTLQANDYSPHDAEYRDGHLWTTQTIACNPGGGTVDCLRWAEIDPTGPSVVDAGVFASDGDYRFFGNVAVSRCGGMGIGYTKSSGSIHPAVWVAGRQAGDTAGTLQGEVELKAGEIVYTAFDGTPFRWGDYSGLTVDPDGTTFWYLGEYSKDTGTTSGRWGTWIGSFGFPCPPVAVDLAVTKSDGQTEAVPGTTVAYLVTASNEGTDDLTGAVVTDVFDSALFDTAGLSWSCTPSAGAGPATTCPASGDAADLATGVTVDLESGDSVEITVLAPVLPSATGSLVNTATIDHPTEVDEAPSNNSATDTDTLTPTADLGITKDDGATTAEAGASVTYTIVASNAGPSDAPGAQVSDTFPAALTGCSWSCVGSDGASCTAGPVAGDLADTADLPAGGTVTYTATCTLDAGASGTLSNTASVSPPSGVADEVPGNDSATDEDSVMGSCGFPDTVTLQDTVIDSTMTVEACSTVTLASGVQVVDPGDLTVRAGVLVVVESGVSVGTGAALTVEIDPVLAPP